MRIFGMILLTVGILALAVPAALIIPLIQYACSMNTTGCNVPVDRLIGDFVTSSDAAVILWLPMGVGALMIWCGWWLRRAR